VAKIWPERCVSIIRGFLELVVLFFFLRCASPFPFLQYSSRVPIASTRRSVNGEEKSRPQPSRPALRRVLSFSWWASPPSLLDDVTRAGGQVESSKILGRPLLSPPFFLSDRPFFLYHLLGDRIDNDWRSSDRNRTSSFPPSISFFFFLESFFFPSNSYMHVAKGNASRDRFPPICRNTSPFFLFFRGVFFPFFPPPFFFFPWTTTARGRVNQSGEINLNSVRIAGCDRPPLPFSFSFGTSLPPLSPFSRSVH